MPTPVTSKGHHLGRDAPNKGKTYPAEVLTEDDVRSLLMACSNRAPTGIRNRAMIVTMYRAGLRLGETLALMPKDVDPDAGTVTVLRGKGDRRRVVGIDPGAMAIVTRWMDKRAALGITRRRRLFCTLDGKPLYPSYVRTMLHRVGEKAGVEKRVHPHGLRHSMAWELTMEGVPLPLIQQQLGHASLATTERYVSHLAPSELIERMQRRAFEV